MTAGDAAVPAEARELTRALDEIIGRGAAATLLDAEFEHLALRVFAFQFAHNQIYRAYCERRAATPDAVTSSAGIPAVPTEAFKAAALVTGDASRAAAVFRTSGTTAGAARRGTHYMLDTGLYRATLLAGVRRHLVPDRDSIPVLSLVPSHTDAPDSSLSFMIDAVMETYAGHTGRYFVDGGELRVDDFVAAAVGASGAGTAVLVVGTSFAFVHLLDALERAGTTLDLPPGSRVMDTGGFKGRSREIGRDELYDWIERCLGVPRRWILNEYGMTEMSSQFYDGVAGQAPGRGERRIHAGPPWVRSTAVDPESLMPLPPGEVGILRHLDLANLYSVAAVQTADVGRITAEGSVELFGRAAGAEPRGCSIATDELLRVMERNR